MSQIIQDDAVVTIEGEQETAQELSNSGREFQCR